MGMYASEVVKIAKAWHGASEANGKHKIIVDLYNQLNPLPRGYKLKYNDAWCAGTLSAIAVKLGYTSIIPCECSVYYMMKKAQEMGIWDEADNHKPKLGEFVVYDWQDNGTGDNKGNPDHVGVVIKVEGNTFHVEEGNYNDAVRTRILNVNGKYIRGFICPKYDEEKTTTTTSKSVEEIAREVVAGKWGNGDLRKKKLEQAGYKYSDVQNAVNNLLNGSKGSESKKSVEEIAREVIKGKWGNGSERKQRLEKAGYNYSEVQKIVNRLS